jgi:hypothetical protein
MRRLSFLPKWIALWLTLGLALPAPPAYALRPRAAGLEEKTPTTQAIEEALTESSPAAGLEELTPELLGPVAGSIYDSLERPGMTWTQAYQQLEEFIRNSKSIEIADALPPNRLIRWLTGRYSQEQLQQPIDANDVTRAQAFLSEPARILRNISKLQNEGFLITPLIVSDLATLLSVKGVSGIEVEDYEFFIHRTLALLGFRPPEPLPGWEGTEPMDFGYAASWLSSQLAWPAMEGFKETYASALRLALTLYRSSLIAATEYSIPLEDLMEAMFLQRGTTDELLPEERTLLNDSDMLALQRLQILTSIAMSVRESFSEGQTVDVDDIRRRVYVRLERLREATDLSADQVDETTLKVVEILRRPAAGLEEPAMEGTEAGAGKTFLDAFGETRRLKVDGLTYRTADGGQGTLPDILAASDDFPMGGKREILLLEPGTVPTVSRLFDGVGLPSGTAEALQGQGVQYVPVRTDDPENMKNDLRDYEEGDAVLIPPGTPAEIVESLRGREAVIVRIPPESAGRLAGRPGEVNRLISEAQARGGFLEVDGVILYETQALAILGESA